MIRYLRWVLRSTQRFRHRVVLLVDSKVVLGAIAKGRSSSKSLNALVRRAAALCFAGGLVLHCVFIPTKHNPSDCHLELMLQLGPLRCEDGFTRLIDQRCVLVVESCRRTTHCIFPSVRWESRVLSTAVAMDLMVVLRTTAILVIGSVTRFGTQSICNALMPSLRLPMLDHQ